MKRKNRKFKRFLHWFSKIGTFILAVLLFTIIITFIWFFSAGTSPSNEKIVIGIAAISAVFSAFSAIATLIQAVEIQKQRENLERPYIVAYFDSENSGALCFVIENSGNSPALDLQIKFSPVPKDYSGRSLDKISLFSNPISFIPAGKIIRQVIDSSYNFLKEGNPLEYSILVSYSSVFGESFSEKIEHDLEYLKQTTLPPKSTNDHLKKISEDLNKLVQNIKSAQGINSFLVESPEAHISRMNDLVRTDTFEERIIRLVRKFFAILKSRHKH